MSQSYIIEVGSQPAGIVVRNPGGYVFIAASNRFNRLDGQALPQRARGRTRRAPHRHRRRSGAGSVKGDPVQNDTHETLSMRSTLS